MTVGDYLELPERHVPLDLRNCRRIHWEAPAHCDMVPPCSYCSTGAGRASAPAVPPALLADGFVDLCERMADDGHNIVVTVAWGEPMSDPGCRLVLGLLARRHRVHINTNLIAPISAWDDIPSTGNVGLNLSFHPEAKCREGKTWDETLDWFRSKRDQVVEYTGATVLCVGIVAHPKFIPFLEEWQQVLTADMPSVGAHFLPFWGTYGGEAYPNAYTAEEHRVVYGDVERVFHSTQWDVEPRGRPCRAGRDYLLVRFDGKIARCPLTQERTFGDLRRGPVAVQNGREPCPAKACSCPDLWEYWGGGSAVQN